MLSAITQVDIEIGQLILLIISLIIMALLIYVALWLFGEKRELDAQFLLKLMLMALIIILLIIIAGVIVGFVDSLVSIGGLGLGSALGLNQMLPVLAYLLSCYAMQYLLLPYNDWKRAVWITFVAFCGFYGFNAITTTFLNTSLIIQF